MKSPELMWISRSAALKVMCLYLLFEMANRSLTKLARSSSELVPLNSLPNSPYEEH